MPTRFFRNRDHFGGTQHLNHPLVKKKLASLGLERLKEFIHG